MLPAAMIDLSFDPIADASAVAGLVLMWWQGRSGQKNGSTDVSVGAMTASM
jgi:hypothetical protein